MVLRLIPGLGPSAPPAQPAPPPPVPQRSSEETQEQQDAARQRQRQSERQRRGRAALVLSDEQADGLGTVSRPEAGAGRGRQGRRAQLLGG